MANKVKHDRLEDEIRVIAVKLKTLGEELRSGTTELKLASELANIHGKELKAQQMILAERIFVNEARSVPPLLGE
jgi:hypothetical protein